MTLLPLAYCESRIGNVRNSLADISKAKMLISYEPLFSLKDRLKKICNTIDMY